MTVLQRLRSLLASPEDDPVYAAHREQLAVALLLGEMARADFDVSPAEQSEMRLLLQHRYQLDEAAADDLLRRGLTGASRATSLHDYVCVLNERLDYPSKVEVVEMLWEMAYADGRLEMHEESELRKIAGLLYISNADFIRAKLRVSEAHSTGED